MVNYKREFRSVRSWGIVLSCSAALINGCLPPPDQTDSSFVFNNTTDATNRGASYVGSATCGVCHPDVANVTRIHGHSHALNPVQRQAPEYAPEAKKAGVPDPPAGNTWADISYVIGGYRQGALFIDANGFLMTTGVEGVGTLGTVELPPLGFLPGFADYLPDQQSPLPYDYECFRCHTTGPQPQDAGNPRSQEGRDGILGTWAEAGVECEACHGPGSNHVPSPQNRDFFVDSTGRTCGRCHLAGDDPDVIVAADGFIARNSQFAELRASGGHADFSCMTCHSPHASTLNDRSKGIRNKCTACHADRNLAFHAGVTFVRGRYVEEFSCESCHMPFATRTVTTAPANIAGTSGRIGDTRTHIFRISTDSAGFAGMFTADGSAVVTDSQGRAAVTVDFVCMRCHTDTSGVASNAVRLDVAGASALAELLHDLPQ